MAKLTFKYRPPPSLAGVANSMLPGVQMPLDEPETRRAARAADRWWYESSYDLLNGLEVSEVGNEDDGADTLPGELFDAHFKR